MIKKLMLYSLPFLACPAIASAQATETKSTNQPAAKPKSAIQQQFDDGTAAIAAGDWQRAFDIYSALENSLAAKNSPSKSLAIVQLRKAQMMYRLGNKAEAEPLITATLAKVNLKDASLTTDLLDAFLTLAEANELRFDYSGSIVRLKEALALNGTDVDKLAVYTRLIPIRIFVDADAALADSDAALAVLARNPEANKEWLGAIRNLRGRTLTNLGRLKEARADLKIAVSKLGGLGASKINLLDAAARSDASIAAMRDNDAEQGRILLAYTGSSQASSEGFRLGVGMEPPACGGKDGPKLEDVAVVEFNINKDGYVGQARPVYYSGERGVAIQFARAVASWFWDADTLKKVNPFFRALTRLEMRCTTIFQKATASDLLLPAVETWLNTIAPELVNLNNDQNSQQGLDALNTVMVKLAKKDGADTPSMIVPLIRLSRHRLIPFALSVNYANRAYNIAKNAGAPASVLAFLATNAAYFAPGSHSSDGKKAFNAALITALADPVITNDGYASAALRLSLFDSLDAKARTAIGADFLKPVADDKRLLDNDPYKVGALTRLASVAVNSGNIEDARSFFARTGLSAQQCALVDARPVGTGGTISDSDYPKEAIQLGLGGWTVVEFDIDARGRTTGQRPLIAWPPFIFGEPAAKGVGGFRFQQTYRPDGGLGCGGQRQRISYALPY